MKTFVIDGAGFSTLEEFFDVVSEKLIPASHWGRNLDAFSGILRGGFGTSKEGFTLVWKNSQTSRERLAKKETIRQLKNRLANCHPGNRESVQKQVEDAEHDRGPTVFDWLIEIIEQHGPKGSESVDNVVLLLK